MAAWRASGLTPNDSTAQECHGTGTSLGDPIEVGSLLSVRRASRSDHTWRLFSAKTYIGHLEIAAGSVGLIKSLLLLLNGLSHPHLHLMRLNPHLDLDASPVIFPTESIANCSSPLFPGVSSFGFGGTNSHAIFTGTPPAPQEPRTRTNFNL